MIGNILPKRTLFFFGATVFIAMYIHSPQQNTIKEINKQTITPHKSEMSLCEYIEKTRDPKNDPMSARIAIEIGNLLLKSSDPKMKIRGMEYLQMGMCLDLEILERHIHKYQIGKK